MSQAGQGEGVALDDVRSLLVEHGYEAEPQADHLRVKDLDSNIVIRVVLQDDILFCTVNLTSVDEARLTADVMRTLLDAENGISTSFFQLYGKGKTALTLNNFCKLQCLGAEDADDILSCLQFLEIDAYAARDLLADVLA